MKIRMNGVSYYWNLLDADRAERAKRLQEKIDALRRQVYQAEEEQRDLMNQTRAEKALTMTAAELAAAAIGNKIDYKELRDTGRNHEGDGMIRVIADEGWSLWVFQPGGQFYVKIDKLGLFEVIK